MEEPPIFIHEATDVYIEEIPDGYGHAPYIPPTEPTDEETPVSGPPSEIVLPGGETPPSKQVLSQTGWEYVITSNPAGASIYVNGNNTFKKTPASIILSGNADYIIMVDLFGYDPAFATVHTDPI